MANKFFGVGRITAIPKLTETPNGTKVCRFTIAVRKQYSNKNEADYLPCEIWGTQAEFAGKHGKKGMLVSVVGSINTYKRNEEDKYANAFNLKLTDFEILSTKEESNEYSNGDMPVHTNRNNRPNLRPMEDTDPNDPSNFIPF